MNQNSILPDDQRLTAYAFDEMAPAERAEFEKLLEQDPAARQVVAEIRTAGALLEGALEHESTAAFAAPVEAAAIIPGRDWRTLDGGKPSPRETLKQPLRFPQFYYMASGLAAACFAIFFVYWQNNAPSHPKPKQYAEVPLGDAVDTPAKQDGRVAVAMPAPEEGKIVVGGLAQRVLAERPAIESPFAPQVGAGAHYEDVESRGLAKSRSLWKANVPAPTGVINGSDKKFKETRFVTANAMQPAERDFNTESYGYQKDNDFLGARDNPLSTFSIDVDTASYANMRRFLTAGRRPPPDAVRIEELVNYFPYRYRAPTGDVPFSANLEVASAPWAPDHRLVRIGLKGREISDAARPAANLVFLLDVSGSMQEPNKLPLVKESLRLLVDKLRADDRVAIAVYAGASGLALPSTPLSRKADILAAIDQLEAGGSTNGAMGIQLAYDVAKANFITGGVNRVILATDGDFNVGVTNQGDLTRLIEEKAKSGVFLSVLGFGMGNYKDSTLESLADKGNGNYAYIDTLAEAKKSLVEQAGGTLVTIAKDVKIQVEFNPAQVQSYRLIGYENRLLKKEDFNDDKVDAGEIGAGHTVTALYEVVPVGADIFATPGTDPLKYQAVSRQPSAVSQGNAESRKLNADSSVSSELLTVKIRYKAPEADESRKLEFALRDSGAHFEQASEDFKFAAAVAGFGMILRESPHKGTMTLADISAWGRQGLSEDVGGYRSEFLGLVQKAAQLQ